MSLETATFIDDLDVSNPGSGDNKSQGDDHLRLIKTVLKASIKRVSRAFYVPGTSASKTADFSVIASDDNRTFLVDTTSGTVTATLPTLTTTDAGWECHFIKTNTGTSPLFIAPASGTIQSGEVAGLAKTRRCIPGHKTRVYWTGTAWYAERVVHVPVGTVLDCPLASKPVGYEWANGQTLSGTAGSVYPDFYSANASSLVVTDRQGRAAFGRTDMDGSDNGLITTAGSSIDGTSLGATGGAQSVTIGQANLPNVSFTNSGIAISVTTPQVKTGTSVVGSGAASANVVVPAGTPLANTMSDPTASVTNQGSAASGGSGTALTNMPPAIITNFIVVVE